MWIPAHTGIPTNDKVDKLTKRGVKKEGIYIKYNSFQGWGEKYSVEGNKSGIATVLGAGDKREAPVFITE